MPAHRPSPRPAAVAALLTALIVTGGTTARADDALEVKAAPITISPGATVEAPITIVIHKDYRVLGDPPPNNFSTPLTVSFDASRALQPRTAILPTARKFQEPQSFSYVGYDGTIVIKVPIKANAGAAPGDYTVHGRMRYQALLMNEQGLSGFLKTTVKLVDLAVRVTAPAKPKATTQAPATPR